MYNYFVHYTTTNPPTKSNGIVNSDDKIITEEHLRALEKHIDTAFKCKGCFIVNITLLHES